MLACVVFAGLLACAWGKTELTRENHVGILTKENFDTVIDEYEYVLVEFYAPWCGHCKALQPEYEKAALQLHDSKIDVLIAKVDATVETELASSHGVSGYPTLKFRKNGQWLNYNGGRTVEDIVKWIERKSQPAIKRLPSLKELEEFLKDTEVAVVGFIKDPEHESYRVLEAVAHTHDHVPFAVITSQEAFDKHGITEDVHISMFKSFDEGRVKFEHPMQESHLNDFVKIESIPLVVDFSPKTAEKVFDSPVKKHVVSFAPKSDGYDDMKSKLESLAKKFKRKFHFIGVDTDVEENKRILEYFGMTEKDVPGYSIINIDDDMTQYKPETADFSESAMESFLNDILSDKVKPFLMSQEIPPPSDSSTRVLVGKNFNEVVQDKSAAVFVLVYAPWCGHCKSLAPIWDELGEAYKDQPDVIIAKMDATANQAEGLKVNSFPTLKFSPKGSSEIIDYTGDRTLEAFKKFVDEGGKANEIKDEL